FAGRIRDDERDAVLAQQVDELRAREARVPNLERVAELQLRRGVEARAARDPRIVTPRERRGLFSGSRQRREEALEAFALEAQRRRQLPEDRAELLAELEQARCEEIRERRLRALEAQHVRDVARALDREHEVVRDVRGPRGVAFRRLQRIEAAVDLDGRELLRGVRELPSLR